jgi:high frequency lysogenization protein
VQKNIDHITIALAGMLQAVALMRELTQTGKTHPQAFEASMESIFKLNVQTVSAVFGGLEGVKLGLEKIVHAFDTTQSTDRLQSRYLLSLIHLQKKLSRSPAVLAQLIKRLEKTQTQVNYFSLTHPTVIANLADIYLHTMQTFKFRILIIGNPRVLHVKENLAKIQAIMLAGVRAAVLWRQMGGSRLQLLFARAKIKATAEKLLAELNQQNNSLAKKEPA